MATNGPMAPLARRFLHRTALGWGIVLLVVWAVCTVAVAKPFASAVSGGPTGMLKAMLVVQIPFGVLLVLGMVLLMVGVSGEIRAGRVERSDLALAKNLGAALQDLWQQGVEAAYAPAQNDVVVQDARLVEIERHFDAVTVGSVLGAIHNRSQIFGQTVALTYTAARQASALGGSAGIFSGAVRGVSQVQLGITSTTRDNLMADALFAVFEAPGPAGPRDTFRVISMSSGGVADWIRQVALAAAMPLQGNVSHAGATLLAWVEPLVARFGPRDISYVTDRLKALQARPLGERDPVVVRGAPVGRNAVMASTVEITMAGRPGDRLHVLPARFAEMFARTLGEAFAASEQELRAGRPRELSGPPSA